MVGGMIRKAFSIWVQLDLSTFVCRLTSVSDIWCSKPHGHGHSQNEEIETQDDSFKNHEFAGVSGQRDVPSSQEALRDLPAVVAYV
jgi:hypothetical protein